MDLTKATKAELEEQLKSLNEQYEGYKARNLKLDMSRGKPGKEQLDLVSGILTVLAKPGKAGGGPTGRLRGNAHSGESQRGHSL